MHAHIPQGQRPDGHPPQYVCFCRRPQIPDCNARHAPRGRSAMLDVASSSCELPLASLCEGAHQRKHETGRPQVLVLYETEPVSLAAAAPRREAEGAADVIPVLVCCLERIGHADLLHALACGFDVIHLQACPGSAGRAHQLQQVELARVLGGLGRILLFEDAGTLAQRLQAGIFPFPSVAPGVLAVGSRRDTVRASAAALLPAKTGIIALPEQAPYGAVSLDESCCTHCSSCVWVCPSDALSLTENGGALSFVESLCFQCGLCVSICPQRALHMEPGMDLTASAVLPQLLTGEEGRGEGSSTEPGHAGLPPILPAG
ncbi:4Fe-4S binding protein [Leisingera caerulea]|uniref:4Fe-4S binding protein n=2 Tax=Leisingera caerulea TaxID=506591 RepID=A0ABY5X0H7_LEICA|nr:4Fe-4S binding protein [Leisingera caerulea]